MEHATVKKYRPVAIGAASVVLTGLIFLFDLSTPHGRAEWLLYLIPLLLSTYAFKRPVVFALASVQSALILIDYYILAGDEFSDIALFNRLLVVFALWVVAYYVTSRQKALDQVEKARVELEKRVHERTLELSAANKSLTEEAERRLALEREKADFLAMVSHDMKSPLSVIHGYAELIIKTKYESLEPDVREMIDAINGSNKKLLRLVEDFVAVSRIEAGKLQPVRHTQAVSAMLKDTADTFGIIAEEKGLTYGVELPDEAARAELDWGLVQRAVSNLIENAMNYTQPGGKTGMAAHMDDGSLVIEVWDTGPGIAKEEQQMVFEKYYRSKRTSAKKGTGLGLAIVRAIAEVHGGRVELDSEPGAGSRFRMVFPPKAPSNNP